VIPILEANSNCVSAPPALVISVPLVSVRQGAGGFAAMLAATQRAFPATETTAGEVEASEVPSVDNAGATTSLNLRMRGSENFQLKKLSNSVPAVAVNGIAAASTVVPGFTLTTANPTPPHPSQATLPQRLAQPSVLRSSLLQPSIQQASISLTPAAEGASFGHSGLSPSAGAIGSATNRFGAESGLADQATPSVLIPDKINGNAKVQEAFTADGNTQTSTSAIATKAIAASAAAPNTNSVSPGNGFENGLASAEPTLLAESTQPGSGVFLRSVSQDNQGSASLVNAPGAGAAEPGPQADQAIELTAPGETVWANAALETAAAPGMNSFSAGNLQIGQENSASTSAIALPTAAPTDPASATGAGNPLAGIINGQSLASPVFNSAGSLVPGRILQRFNAPRIATAIADGSVRSGASAGASAPASALWTATDSSDESAVASQTPFSVFFSGPAPGTESAVSTLPKMILPLQSSVLSSGQSSAIGDSHPSGINASSVSAQTSGLQSGISPNAALQNTKDSIVGNQSGSQQAGQAIHRDGELNAVSQESPLAQPATAPPPPISPGVTLLAGGQATLAADALPKTDAPTEGARNSVPTPPAVVGESAAVVAPGPVQVAQMVNRIGQSEMRIGMNTAAFGSVEVRTVVHANDVGLVIGSEKGDLRTLLANEMPAITNTLQQQNLRLNSVNFMQGFAFSNNASGGGDSQQRSFVPMRASASPGLSGASVEDAMEPPVVGEFGGGSGSFSILA
jgi:hypothetical protein